MRWSRRGSRRWRGWRRRVRPGRAGRAVRGACRRQGPCRRGRTARTGRSCGPGHPHASSSKVLWNSVGGVPGRPPPGMEGVMDLPDRLIPLVDEGLGNSAYLLDLGDGRALAVDPSLDLRAASRQAARRGLRIAYAAETHLHADFLSGARQLAADHDARILASVAGKREFDHRGLADGDEVDLGGLTLRAWETPGHTPEHLSYLLLDGGREVAV